MVSSFNIWYKDKIQLHCLSFTFQSLRKNGNEEEPGQTAPHSETVLSGSTLFSLICLSRNVAYYLVTKI